MDGFLQPILPLPKTHGTPDHYEMARASALRSDAAEVADRIGHLTARDAGKLDALLRNHELLMLRSIAAAETARGNLVLARHYDAAADRVEAGL